MALEKIPDVGDNALNEGFLNKKYAQKVVDFSNLLLKWEVKTPQGFGAATVKVSKENVVLDLTKLTPGGGGTLQIYAVYNGGATLINFAASIAGA